MYSMYLFHIYIYLLSIFRSRYGLIYFEELAHVIMGARSTKSAGQASRL